MRFTIFFTLIALFANNGVAADQLNVLLVMVDDLRDFGGAFTRDVVKTPNLDRLRAHGTTFERAYVQYPVCNPSRTSMMTGLRAEQTGIVGNDTRLRQKLPEIITMPQLCKEAGWQSHAFGKLYHLGGGKNLEAKQAWMDTGKSWHTAQAYEATTAGKKMLEGRNVTDGALNWCQWGAADGTDDDQPDGQIAAATVAKINELGDTPWFIGCGFMKPHDPFIAPKKYFDFYPLESLRIWRDPSDMTVARKEAVGFGAYGDAFAKFKDKEWKELFRAYCAGTSFMDAQLGRVLDALDENKLWDKTLVIFVGDHGYHTGERNWWNKNTLFERSCRAPLVIAAPGMRGGQTSRSLVEFVDLYPTIADLCGLKLPHDVVGKSLRAVLMSPEATVKDAAFTLVTRGPKLYGQSIRTAGWRFTKWSDERIELYEHERDPEELHDVSNEHPEIVKALSLRMEAIGKPQL
jgi:iduronate 2-sulfatase